MKKITYISGQYSQLKLDDGSRIFVETLPEKIRIKKMFIGIIPTKTIWEYKFPFYIRTVGSAWSLAQEILDLVLESIKNCSTVAEIIDQLHKETNQLLENYVRKNEAEAYMIGIEKLGRFAAEKYIKSSSMLQDTLSISRDTMDIIGDYGMVLEKISKESNNMLKPVSKLPHPKEKIEDALKAALKITKDEKLKNDLLIALTALDDFVRDEEVPSDPIENMAAWAKRRGIKERKDT